jgi:hypothetical protein
VTIIGTIAPGQCRTLNERIARAIEKFKKPGDLNPWPF